MHLGISPFEVIKTRVAAIKAEASGSGGCLELDFEHAASANTKTSSIFVGKNAVKKVVNISSSKVYVSLFNEHGQPEVDQNIIVRAKQTIVLNAD